MLPFRQASKGVGQQLVPDIQVAAKSREHNAVTWVFVHRAKLVHFTLRQGTELGFSFSLAVQISQIGFGLVAENGFAESVKPAAFSKNS